MSAHIFHAKRFYIGGGKSAEIMNVFAIKLIMLIKPQRASQRQSDKCISGKNLERNQYNFVCLLDRTDPEILKYLDYYFQVLIFMLDNVNF